MFFFLLSLRIWSYLSHQPRLISLLELGLGQLKSYVVLAIAETVSMALALFGNSLFWRGLLLN